MAVREGCWDCPSCDGTNLGRYLRCQGCGAGRGEDVEFYLPDDAAEVLPDNPLYAQAKGGPDWICGYCEVSNLHGAEACRSCGADGAEGVHREVTETTDEPPPPPPEEPHQHSRGCGCGCLGSRVFQVLLLLFLLYSWWGGRTHLEDLEVLSSRWQRSVAVEQYQTLQKEDWRDAVPGDARVHGSEEKFRTTRKVFDHSETRTRTVYDEVPSGTERYKCGTRNLGNGFFEDKYCSRTTYRRVAREETYTHDVYRDEPVYDTWQRYEVDRWVEVSRPSLSGDDHQPRWPESGATRDAPDVLGTRREGPRSEEYRLRLQGRSEVYEREVDLDFFLAAPPGSTVYGRVTNLDKLRKLCATKAECAQDD